MWKLFTQQIPFLQTDKSPAENAVAAKPSNHVPASADSSFSSSSIEKRNQLLEEPEITDASTNYMSHTNSLTDSNNRKRKRSLEGTEAAPSINSSSSTQNKTKDALLTGSTEVAGSLSRHTTPIASSPDSQNQKTQLPPEHSESSHSIDTTSVLLSPTASYKRRKLPITPSSLKPVEPPAADPTLNATLDNSREERKRAAGRERQRKFRQRKNEKKQLELEAEREVLEKLKEERKRAMNRERQRKHRERKKAKQQPELEAKRQMKEEAREKDRRLIADKQLAKPSPRTSEGI